MKKLQKIMAIIIMGVILMQSFVLTGANVYATDNLSDNTANKEDDNMTTTNSNIELEVSQEDSLVKLEVKNVNSSCSYKIKITNTKSKPSETDWKDMNKENGWKDLNSTTHFTYINEYMELNDPMYVWMCEYNNGKVTEVLAGKEIEHIALPNDARLFHSTSSITYVDTQISLTAPKSSGTQRKVTYAIGEINDNNILNDIKNEKNGGFDSLLNYAKQGSNYIAQGNLTTETDIVNIGGKGSGLDLKGRLTDKKYYYVYVKADDENGKYYPVEGVTITQAKVFTTGGWFLFLYGKNDFSWDNVGAPTSDGNSDSPTTTTDDGKKEEEGKKDDTIAKTPIPQTGQAAIISVVAVVALLGLGAVIRYRNIQIK